MADAVNTACIFCEATGATVKITKEHTFSDWINDVLTPTNLGPDITCERSISHGPGGGTVNSWPVTQVASHKVRDVCKPCNEGWMSGHCQRSLGNLVGRSCVLRAGGRQFSRLAAACSAG